MEKPLYADLLKEKLEHAPVDYHPTACSGTKSAIWISDEIKPELIAAVTNMGRNELIHPTKPMLGESLPEGYSRSSTGFLLRNTILEVEVDQGAVQREAETLQRHAIIAYFVGGRQSTATLRQWIEAIEA